MIPKQVTLKEIKFENQYYVTGHFNFIFMVSYDDNDSEQKIIRRYNDIRSLYKTLLLKSPGCRIPDIPNKSIWLKINYGNESQVKERQEGIMEFLNHLVQHKILRKNKYVIKFFSPNEKSFSYTNNLLSKQKYSSNAIERNFEKKEMYINEVCNENNIIDTIKNKYGNYVIQKAVKLSSGIFREKIIGKISKVINKLEDKRIINKWKAIISFKYY